MIMTLMKRIHLKFSAKNTDSIKLLACSVNTEGEKNTDGLQEHSEFAQNGFPNAGTFAET